MSLYLFPKPTEPPVRRAKVIRLIPVEEETARAVVTAADDPANAPISAFLSDKPDEPTTARSIGLKIEVHSRKKCAPDSGGTTQVEQEFPHTDTQARKAVRASDTESTTAPTSRTPSLADVEHTDTQVTNTTPRFVPRTPPTESLADVVVYNATDRTTERATTAAHTGTKAPDKAAQSEAGRTARAVVSDTTPPSPSTDHADVPLAAGTAASSSVETAQDATGAPIDTKPSGAVERTDSANAIDTADPAGEATEAVDSAESRPHAERTATVAPTTVADAKRVFYSDISTGTNTPDTSEHEAHPVVHATTTHAQDHAKRTAAHCTETSVPSIAPSAHNAKASTPTFDAEANASSTTVAARGAEEGTQNTIAEASTTPVFTAPTAAKTRAFSHTATPDTPHAQESACANDTTALSPAETHIPSLTTTPDTQASTDDCRDAIDSTATNTQITGTASLQTAAHPNSTIRPPDTTTASDVSDVSDASAPDLSAPDAAHSKKKSVSHCTDAFSRAFRSVSQTCQPPKHTSAPSTVAPCRNTQTQKGDFVELPIVQISKNPNQPRTHFDQAALAELAESIRVHGILQPLTVRPSTPTGANTPQFELIAGERRLRAAILCGLSTVPCIIMHLDAKESALFALIENIQRENLNFFEEARAIRAILADFSCTQSEIAAHLGCSQSYIANKTRLLRLSDVEQTQILANNLSERHARALLQLPSEEARIQTLAAIIKNTWTVAETERFIASYCESAAKKAETAPDNPLATTSRLSQEQHSIDRAIARFRRKNDGISCVKRESATAIEWLIRMPLAQTTE